jgi:hypothetical protein
MGDDLVNVLLTLIILFSGAGAVAVWWQQQNSR